MLDGFVVFLFFFIDTATTEIYTLSLHDALPIFPRSFSFTWGLWMISPVRYTLRSGNRSRSEEHTSELQSLRHLVCRLLLEKKKRAQCHAAQYSRAEQRCYHHAACPRLFATRSRD